MAALGWNGKVLSRYDVREEAVESIANYLALPALRYAIKCRVCGKIIPDCHVKDPGFVRESHPSCSECRTTCLTAGANSIKPTALADSLVPGSFVFAPIRKEALSVCEWPAIVDYCPEKSAFCELGLNGKPVKYFVTFILSGDLWFGGWFEDRDLTYFDESKKFKHSTDELKKARKECESMLDSPMASRLRRFSFLGRMLTSGIVTPGGRARLYGSQKSDELEPEEVKKVIKDATKEFFNDIACSFSSAKIWPSAAFRVVYYTSRLHAFKKHPHALGKTHALSLFERFPPSWTSFGQPPCQWKENPFAELKEPEHWGRRRDSVYLSSLAKHPRYYGPEVEHVSRSLNTQKFARP